LLAWTLLFVDTNQIQPAEDLSARTHLMSVRQALLLLLIVPLLMVKLSAVFATTTTTTTTK
jgi:hypothetical protein